MATRKIFTDQEFQPSAFLVNPKVHSISDLSQHSGSVGQLVTYSANLYFHDGSNWFTLIESNYSGNLTGAPNFDPSSGSIPFTVGSGHTGRVDNLNADYLDGYDTSTTATSSAIPVYGTSGVLNVGTPTGDTHAATKLYVDNAIQGLDIKPSVAAATTASITLSGNQTIDGVSITAGMRVLVKDQSTASENGIYVSSASAWALAEDSDSGSLSDGAYVFVENGTTQNNTGWTYVNDGAYTWVQFSGAGQITAGDGLTKTGDTLNASVALPLSISNDQITIADGAISGVKLDSGIAGDGLAFTTGVLSVNVSAPLSISADTLTIADGAIGGAKLNTAIAGDGLGISAGVLSVNVAGPISIVNDDLTIADGAITGVKLNSAIAGNGIGFGSGVMSVNTTGPITIVNDLVTIEDGALTGAKLADNTVTSTQLANSITVTDLLVQDLSLATLIVGSTGGAGAELILDGAANGDGAGGDVAYIKMTSGDDLHIVNQKTAGTMLFATGSVTRATIAADGKVKLFENTGIGGDPSSTYTLYAYGNSKIGGTLEVSTPTANAHAATKGYVDGAITSATPSVALPISYNASSEITIADGAIGGAKLANNTVTSTQLADDISVSSLAVGLASPTSVTGNTVAEIIGSSGGEVIIGNSTAGTAANDFVGGLAFKNSDTSGSGANATPHYSGIKAKAGDIYGNSTLEFYAGRGRYEAGTTPDLIIYGSTTTSDGNVQIANKLGIGVHPSRHLHIDGGSASATGIYLDADGISGTDIEQSANDFRLQVRDNIPLLLFTNNTTRLTVESDGDVKVHERLGVGGTPVSVLSLVNGSRTLDFELQDTPASGDQGIQLIGGSGDSIGIAAGGTGPGLVLDTSNRLGIRTDSMSSQDSTADDLVVGDGLGHYGITLYSAATYKGTIAFGDPNSNYQGAIVYDHNNDSLALFTGGTSRFSIDSSGNGSITGTFSAATPTATGHLATKGYVDSSITNNAAAVAAPVSYNASNQITIADGALTGAKLANNTVTSTQLADTIQVSSLDIVGTGHTRLKITAGTTSDAQIHFGDSDDDDIGMINYDNAQNSLKFVVNAAERMRLTSTGLCIGNQDAARTLDLTNSGQMTFGDSVSTNSTATGIYWHVGSGYGIYRTSGSWSSPNYQQLKLEWATGIILNPGSGTYGKSHVGVQGGLSVGDSYFTTKYDNGLIVQGSVGVGTTSAGSYKLYVNGNSYIDSTSANSTLILGRYSGQRSIQAGSDDGGYLIMDSNGGANAGVAALNWYSSDNVVLAYGGGNVGIGTNDPKSRLHIADSGGTGLEFIPQDSNSRNVIFSYKRSTSQYRQLELNAYDFRFVTSGTNDRVTINNAGHVSINATPSSSYKLYVNGNTHIDATYSNPTLLLGRANGYPTVKAVDVNGGHLILEAATNSGTTFINNYVSANVAIASGGGDVGIGSTNATGFKLFVNDSSTAVAKFQGTTNAYCDFTDGTINYRVQVSGDAYIGTTTNHKLHFKTNGSTRATIDTSGYVGLSNTNPQALLHVGSGNFPNPGSGYDQAHFGGLSFLFRNNRDVYLTSNSYFATTGWLTKYNGYAPLRHVMLDGRYEWHIGSGTTAGSGSGFTEYMRLTSTGLGIGVDPSGASLDVKSNIIVRDTDSNDEHIQLFSNGTEGVMRLRNGANWGFIARGSGNNPYIGAYSGGSLNIVGFTSPNGSSFNSTLAQFDFTNQRVSIGGTNPSEKLSVIGNIQAYGRMDGALWNSPVPGISSFSSLSPSSGLTKLQTGKYLANAGNFRGLVWTGKHYIATTYDDTVHYYDSNFDSIENHRGNSSETLPNSPYYPHGAAWDGRYLWVTEYGSSTSLYLTAYDLGGSSITRVARCSVNTNVNDRTYGIGYAEGLLYLVIDGRVQAYRWEGGDSATQVFSNPSIYNAGATTFDAQGITYDGSHLWVSQNNQALYKLSLDGDIITTISAADNPLTQSCGHTWNGENLVSFNYATREIEILNTDQRVFLTQKVGIGAAPDSVLDIKSADPILTIEDSSASSFATTNTRINFDISYATVGYIQQSGETLRIASTGGSSSIKLSTNGSDRVTIDTGGALDVLGKVKINTDGTINWGNAKDSGRLTWSTNKAVIRGESGKALSLGANGTQDQLWISTDGNIGVGTTNPGTEKLYVDTGSSTFNRGNSAGDIVHFRGQNAEKAVIGTATSYFLSNVGIGTSNPGSYNLYVNGDVYSPNLSNKYSLPNTGNAPSWVKLGVLTTTQSGKNTLITISAGSGYNAASTQNTVVDVHFRTSNNNSNQSGFYGSLNACRRAGLGTNNNQPTYIRVVQTANSTSEYTFYGYFATYTGVGSFYEVSVSPGQTWVNSASAVSEPTGTYLNVTPTLLPSGSGIAGRVALWDGSTNITSGGLFYDATNTRLGVGIAPSSALHVNGSSLVTGRTYIYDSNRYLEASSAGVALNTAYGYIFFGPANASYAHIQTDRARFYFNKALTVDSGLVESYDEDLKLNASQTGGNKKILFQSGGASYAAMDATGKWGLGTVAPTHQLHVAGTAKFTSTVTIGPNSGVIKEVGSDITIVQGAVGLRINDVASAISPTNATVNNDNAVDLGVNNIRFKNLYLAGKLTNDGSGGLSVDAAGDVDILGNLDVSSISVNGTTTANRYLGTNSSGTLEWKTASSNPYITNISMGGFVVSQNRDWVNVNTTLTYNTGATISDSATIVMTTLNCPDDCATGS